MKKQVKSFERVRSSVLLCFTESKRQEWAGGKPRISSFVPPLSDSKCLDHVTLASKPSDGDGYSHGLLTITKLVFLDLHCFLLIWKVAKQIQHKHLHDAPINYIRLNLWQSPSARGGTPAVRSCMCHCSKGNTVTASVPPVLINKNIIRSPLKRKLFPFKHRLTTFMFAIMKWDYLLQKSFTEPWNTKFNIWYIRTTIIYTINSLFCSDLTKNSLNLLRSYFVIVNNLERKHYTTSSSVGMKYQRHRKAFLKQ